jgi:hypothetical protein
MAIGRRRRDNGMVWSLLTDWTTSERRWWMPLWDWRR